MTDIPRTGGIWRHRASGRSVTIADAGATATTGARVAYTDPLGRRRHDAALADFVRDYEPARTRPHVLDAAIGLALAEEPGILPEEGDRWLLCTLTSYAGDVAQGGARPVDMAMAATLAAAWAALLDTAGRPATTEADQLVRREEILIYDCAAEYDRAAAMHYGSIPYDLSPHHPDLTDTQRAAILIEAVGEVAGAMIPDATAPTGHAGDLRAELVRAATMALAWAARMLADTDTPDTLLFWGALGRPHARRHRDEDAQSPAGARTPAGPDGGVARTWRKRTVDVQAAQLTGETAHDHAVYQWVEALTLGSFEPLEVLEGRAPVPASGISIDPATGHFLIATLEGLMRAPVGWWIIRGVAGEFYPCAPDVFAATYQEAS